MGTTYADSSDTVSVAYFSIDGNIPEEWAGVSIWETKVRETRQKMKQARITNEFCHQIWASEYLDCIRVLINTLRKLTELRSGHKINWVCSKAY